MKKVFVFLSLGAVVAMLFCLKGADIVHEFVHDELKLSASSVFDVRRETSFTAHYERNFEHDPNVSVITVVNGNQVPVEGVHVFSCSRDSVLESMITNAEGDVFFSKSAMATGLVVVAPASFPLYRDYSFDKTHRILVLNGDHSFHGRVILHQQPTSPGKHFSLQLNATQKLLPDELSQHVLQSLSSVGIRFGVLKLDITKSGEFIARHLPSSWAGRLALSDDYWVCSTSASEEFFMGQIPVSAHDNYLEVLVHPVKSIKGRVASRLTHDGIANIPVSIIPRSHQGGAGTVYGGKTQDGGWFSIPFTPSNARQRQEWCQSVSGFRHGTAEVVFSAAGKWCSGREFVNFPPSETLIDLGEFFLDEAEGKPVRVEDLAGNPVAGAVVFSGSFSPMTDEFGRTEVFFDESCDEILVNAVGYQVVRVPAYLLTDEALRIRLRPAAELTVSWDTKNFEETSEIIVRMKSNADLFGKERDSSEGFDRMLFVRLGARIRSAGYSDQDATYYVDWTVPEGASQIRLWPFLPIQVYSVQLLDQDGAPLSDSLDVVWSQPELLEITFP